MIMIDNKIKFILDIIKHALEGSGVFNLPRADEFEAVNALLKQHEMLTLAYLGCTDSDISADQTNEVFKEWEDFFYMYSMREAYQHKALQELREEFQKEGIEFLPLKGCVLKELYPAPQMRYMVDLDILYKPERTDDVNKVMERLGYRKDHVGEVHDVYMKEPFVTIEMHKKLLKDPADQVEFFSHVWERSHRVEEGSCEFMMSWEDFYLYFLVHMVKHFEAGGVGLRAVVDFHILYQKIRDILDRTYVDEFLHKFHMKKFEETLIELDQCCFYDVPWTDDLAEVFSYIVYSGVMGNVKNHQLNRVIKMSDSKGSLAKAKFKNYCGMIFFERWKWEEKYPWLKGRFFLVPFAWIHRVFYSIFFDRKRLVSNFKEADTSIEDIQRVRRIMKKTGLKG